MSNNDNPIARQPVVLTLPGMQHVLVTRDIPYRDAGARQLGIDVYRPPSRAASAGAGAPFAPAVGGIAARGPRDEGEPLPAVILVTGYSDVGAPRMLGCIFKQMAAYTDWARLIACAGLAAVLYENEEPVADARRVVEHVRAHAAALGIDAARLGIWACSGNVPNALALAAEDGAIGCAALLYGYMLDAAGHDEVAAAARQYHFATPAHADAFAALAATPLLVARAGGDATPGLNASLDLFVACALEASYPLTVLNHPRGPHAFDLFDASAQSRAMIRQILAFFTAHLGA